MLPCRLRSLAAPSCLALALLTAAPAAADTAVLSADRDTMMTGEDTTYSNGSGVHFCVGANGSGSIRRSLLRFALTGIPAGSTVTSVTLDLYQNNAAFDAGGSYSVHRVTADWGEGASDAPTGECQGGFGQLNDATWRWRFYNPLNLPASIEWASLGGDYVSTASASLILDGADAHRLWSSPQLTADVQAWLDGAAPNYGWLIRRDEESGSGNAVRFASRTNGTPSQRPALIVTYTPPASEGACCFAGQSCQVLAAGTCGLQGGSFLGAGTDCTPNPCPPDPMGACCLGDGTCSDETAASCAAEPGSYQGNGTTCGGVACPIALEPYVDPLPIPAVAQPVSGTPGGPAHYTIAMREIQQQLHRDLPPTTVWGYGDGSSGATFPGPTIEARANAPVSVDWINDLRDTQGSGDPPQLRTDHYLDVAGTGMPPACSIHGAEDAAKVVVHLHGAHVRSEYDGYPEFAYLPGNGSTYHYANDQLPAMLWYHDHALGLTRLNVYMGLAGGYVIRDAFEQELGLPSAEFEIPLLIQDRSFHPDGRLKYAAPWVEHFFGDKTLVNGKVWPFLDVKQGKYRFRVLNGSNSRTYTLALDRQDLPGTADVPLVLIGTDGGLRETPLEYYEITLAPAERADIVVDFQGLSPGTAVLLTNSAPAPYPGPPGSGVVPQVMKFVVQDASGHTAALPASLRALEELQETDAIRVRDFTLTKVADACESMWLINGLKWEDVTEYPQLGTTEIWRFVNPQNMMHPMHMHLMMFQVLDRQPVGGGGSVPPDPSEIGWKDTVRAEAGMVTRVIARFEDYAGLYAYHCHILEHEDHEMMRQFRTVDTIQVAVGPSTVTWTMQPGAEAYDVVRGDLVRLVATGGNFALPVVTRECIANDWETTTVPDAILPAAGQGFWYLVRPVDTWGNGTYDSGYPSQVDQRDDEIAASGHDCP